MTKLHSTDPKTIVTLLLTDLTVVIPSDETLQREYILVEYLRMALNVLSNELNINGKLVPIHIHKLTYMVCEYLETIWSDIGKSANQEFPFNNVENIEGSTKNPILNIINRLSLIGEFSNSGHGFWLPAPLRLIQLPYTEDIAVIGGLSTAQIRQTFPDITIAGYGRILKNTKLPKRYHNETNWWQTYTDWIGWLPQDLQLWTKKQIDHVVNKGSYSSQTFNDFEVFIPTRKQLTYSPWTSAKSIEKISGLERVMLCRTKTPIRYFLGDFESGKILKEFELPNQEYTRWLMIGLLLRVGNTPSASWNENELRVYPILPIALERHLSLYSLKFPNDPTPWLYYIPVQMHKQVEELLKRFGYKFQSKGGSSNGSN